MKCWKCGHVHRRKRRTCEQCDSLTSVSKYEEENARVLGVIAKRTVCHFQEPITGGAPSNMYLPGFNCALTTYGNFATARELRKCYPEMCPMYQSWRLTQEMIRDAQDR
jgi:hypothetical protein